MTLRSEVRTAPVARGTFDASTTTGWTSDAVMSQQGTYVGDDNPTYTFTVAGDGVVGTTEGLFVTWSDGRSPANQGAIDVGSSYTGGAFKPVAEGLEVAFTAQTLVNAETRTIDANAAWTHPDEALAIAFTNDSGKSAVMQDSAFISIDQEHETADGQMFRILRPLKRQPSLSSVSYMEDAGDTSLDTLHRIEESRQRMCMFPIWNENTVLFAAFQRDLRPEIGPYPTFTASGTAKTHTDGRTGLVVKTTSADVARYEAGEMGDALLVEEGRTNFCLQSEDLTTTWATGGTAAVTANQTTAPDGTLTADELNLAADGDTLTMNTGESAVDAEVVIATGYLRTDEADHSIEMIAHTSSGTGGNETTTCAVTKTWARFESDPLTYSTPSGNMQFQFKANGAAQAGKVFAWGCQLEKVGSATRRASTYIPTTTASVARGADLLYYPAQTTVPWINAEEGTWAVGFRFRNYDGAAVLSLGKSTSWDVRIEPSGVLRWTYGTGASNNVDFAQYDLDTNGGFSEGDWVHAAGTWDKSTNTAILYVSGVAVDTNSTTATGLQSPLPSRDVYPGATLSGGAVELRNDYPIQYILMDKAARTAAEVLDIYQRWTVAVERIHFRRNQGRRLYLAASNLVPLGGGSSSDKWRGSLDFVQAGYAKGQRIGAEV
ncbi:MAG: LamG-like jellyroll fold domain-containing protein [Rhodospirillaceae bacterium]